MRKKVLAALAAFFMIATGAQAAEDAFFSNSLYTSGNTPGAFIASQNTFTTPDLNFNGSMSAEAKNNNGVTNTLNTQSVFKSDYGSVGMGNQIITQLSSNCRGFAETVAQNFGMINIPIGYGYVEGQAGISVQGNGAASAGTNSSFFLNNIAN